MPLDPPVHNGSVNSDSPVAVYVHTPFCPSKCGYCDFNSYAMTGEIVERTVRATVLELERSEWAGRPAKTIFFGGGTPTFLAEDQLLRIFEAVVKAHPPIDGAEITSEANPGTVDMPKFRAMRRAGFNRISLGAQSFLDTDLITLGRVHRTGHIERAVGAAREAGFDNVNLDLMFALPNQSAKGWDDNLNRALGLAPEHLSLYCLTIEQNTAFYKLAHQGKLELPDEEAQVEMYEDCLDRMAAAGFRQYEISNFALPGRECRHNLCYWSAEEYANYGPGAVGRVGNVRRTNWKHPERYCEALEGGRDAFFESEALDDATQRVETIMLGLRMNEGFAFRELGLDAGALSRLVSRGWVEVAGDRLRLSRAGRHFCSEVALELI